MARNKTQYECSACGARHGSWSGKCTTCGEWNTLQEIADQQLQTGSSKHGGKILQSHTLIDALQDYKLESKRIRTGDEQLDIVLGGGIVLGSVILLAGQPGIGKSTLLLQLAASVSKNYKILYVSGEESLHQIASRAERLGIAKADIACVATSNADDIAQTIASKRYDCVIVDSVQTVATEDLQSVSGSVAQIVQCTQRFTRAAKSSNTAVILVGHVTKEGSIAGPKVLEHTVDAVLNFEGDRYGGIKLVRSVKNRFGSTNEVAMYDMKEQGLIPIENPSALLLSERQRVDGSVVMACMEGTRAVLVEVQALVHTTSYGYPKRASSGFDVNRLNLLIAMLEKRTKLSLQDKDVYINIVGGIKVSEPAADLAVIMAIASAAKGMKLNKDAVVFGELGLSGEVRRVPYVDKRVAESKKLGFEAAIGPDTKLSTNASYLISVTDVRDALNTFLKSA